MLASNFRSGGNNKLSVQIGSLEFDEECRVNHLD